MSQTHTAPSSKSIKAKNTNADDIAYIKRFENKLSDTTTKYGKWINNPNEHEDHPGQALITRNHDVIKQWAQKRNAKPATVPETGPNPNKKPGVLRFNFPGFGGGDLQEISWDEWFKAFDSQELAFIFQEKMKNGNQSNFFQMDNPHREHD